jgi:hypothetical protein
MHSNSISKMLKHVNMLTSRYQIPRWISNFFCGEKQTPHVFELLQSHAGPVIPLLKNSILSLTVKIALTDLFLAV